jgi:hypothetical protein
MTKAARAEAASGAIILARSLAIPEGTVLRDRGADPVAAPPRRKETPARRKAEPTRLSDELMAEWRALEQDARARGLGIPRLEDFLKLQGAFGQRVDERAVRSSMAALRKSLAKAAALWRR